MKRASILSITAIAFLLLASCGLGPNYSRPQVPMPPQYRGAEQTSSTSSLAGVKPSDLFHDPELTQLLHTAFAQNNDLQIAAQRVLEARAQYGIARSNQFPSLDATGTFEAARVSSVGSYTFVPQNLNLSASYTQAGFNLSWEIDLWGRLHRLTESARAQYLASEEAQHGVAATVAADVMTNYLSLLELDTELEIAKQTEDVAKRGLQLTELRRKQGAATGLDVHQAEELLYSATAQTAATQRALGMTENALSLLLGQNPEGIPRDRKLAEIPDAAEIPAGLPASLLERRPDIREAEDTLVSANAQIGAAKALYFPQISLTGFLGGQSRSLDALFTGPARLWTIAPAGDLSIFNAGRLRNNVRFTEAQKREMVVTYRKAVENGFREVSDALIEHDKDRQQREQEELYVKALQDAERLSILRYKGGLDSYLQVLDAERNLFQGELTLAQLRRDELIAVVDLYRALGGGWS